MKVSPLVALDAGEIKWAGLMFYKGSLVLFFHSLAYAKGEKFLVSGSADGTMMIWGLLLAKQRILTNETEGGHYSLLVPPKFPLVGPSCSSPRLQWKIQPHLASSCGATG